VDRTVLAGSTRHDTRFSDEQIFTMLRAGEEDEADIAVICETGGATIPMYCLWKARYGPLALPELRTARRRERQRALILRASLVAALVLIAGGAGVVLLPDGASRAASAQPAPVASARPAAAAPALARASIGASLSNAPDAPTADMPAAPPSQEGFAVQVAAEPDRLFAGEILGRLEAAGYSAYLLPITVGQVELFRVRIGPFETQREALAIVQRLEREGYEGAWLAR
jgi:hypothetical protein